MYASRAPLPPPRDRAARAGGAGAIGGLLGGLGGAITCLCCLSALSLIGLWAAFIPLVAFFKYAYEQDTRPIGGTAATQSIQQVALLLGICLLTMAFIKRQTTT